MKIDRSLGIRDHNDEILLQIDRQFRPIGFIQTVAHFQKTLRGQFTKIAIQE